MRLILVRHGETACNVRDVWHGWDDCALTERGLEQAQAIAARLADEPIDAVYCSDAPRALQTAQAVAGPHGIRPIPDPGLRERNAGAFEGVATTEVVARHPRIWEERNADYWGWSPPGGETFRQVLERVEAVLERIAAQYPDGTVVLVTHMGPVRVLISRLAGISLAGTYELSFPSTCLSIFSIGDGAGTVELLNDAAHLPQ
ncbi:MAG TPA: histidine phosphatase family protein [Chloroflexota bacterium]|nr:histidine phosphatase family protein [Chloroflexota bacterium]